MKGAPRIDLHRHLDGNIRIGTILELADQNGIVLPATDVEGLRPFVTITTPQPGLMDFLAKFEWSMRVLATPDDCRRVAFENVEDAAREKLDGVELRFSPLFMAREHGLDPAAVVEAVADGVAAGVEKFGIPACLIGILSRTFGVEDCSRELDALVAFREKITALDLAGDEAGFPPALFVEHFRKGRDAGWRVTVHAGEAAGPQSVRDAIELLGAVRIGHGIRSIEDPALLDLLAERGIGLECCPTSNVQTSTVASYSGYPLREFLRRGILATLNTDDPGISGIDFDHELQVAAPACGLDSEDIRQCLANAGAITFLEDR